MGIKISYILVSKREKNGREEQKGEKKRKRKRKREEEEEEEKPSKPRYETMTINMNTCFGLYGTNLGMDHMEFVWHSRKF